MLNVFSCQRLQWLPAMGLAVTGSILLPLIAWAQAIDPVVRDRFLSDPEFAEPRDELLPVLPIMRPLSPLERSALADELDALAAEAEALYLAGQTDLAFQAWMREVRLRRILGLPEEIPAIQRVGLRAWESSRGQEVQLLTLRLQEIQAELLTQESANVEQLEQIAVTFEILRDIDSAIALYTTLIARAVQSQETSEQQRLLERLASLQESWFRFEAAGETYQTLLTTVDDADLATLKRPEYLRGAIRNYQDAGQLKTTIQLQRLLVRQYETSAQLQPIPAVLLAISRNYRALEELEASRAYYRTTYTAALSLGQSSVAGDAVRDLAALYLSLDRPEDVRYLYQQQVAVDSLSYNAFGIMEAFEKLGQLYQNQGNPEAAISAYQEALVLASHLGHRELYFKNRLQQLMLAEGRLTVTPASQHQSFSPLGTLEPSNIWNENPTSL